MTGVLRTFSDRCRDLSLEVEKFLSTDVNEQTRIIFRQIEDLFNTVEQEITDIRRNMIVVNSHAMEVAKQDMEITAAMLSTSTTTVPAWHSTANDLLLVASETDVEFDYRDFWKEGKFVLSPGKGVYYLKVIPDLDQEYPDILQDQTAVYCYDATHLQLVMWNSTLKRWEAQSWKAGWVVWHWLEGPAGGFL